MQTGYKVLKPKRLRKQKRRVGKPGRPRGSLDIHTIEKQLLAKRELLAAANHKIATEHMDEQIGWLELLVEQLNPFDETGHVIKGKSSRTYFRAFELYRDFLSMRAPYQSPRLSAVQVVPAGQGPRRTTVNVTILNERGEKEWSDVPEDLKQIEHVPNDEEAA
jgi:hypothetical protein